MLYSYTLETPAENLCPITAQVQGAVADSGITDGICVVYCPHTTAGITINENADPDVVTDLLLAYRKAFPDRPEFRHMEGNSSAHARASAMGSSVTIPVRNGRLVLGTWQGRVLLRIRRSTPPDVLCQRHCRIERGRYHGNGKNQTIAAMGGSVGSYRVFLAEPAFLPKAGFRTSAVRTGCIISSMTCRRKRF